MRPSNQNGMRIIENCYQIKGITSIEPECVEKKTKPLKNRHGNWNKTLKSISLSFSLISDAEETGPTDSRKLRVYIPFVNSLRDEFHRLKTHGDRNTNRQEGDIQYRHGESQDHHQYLLPRRPLPRLHLLLFSTPSLIASARLDNHDTDGRASLCFFT